MELTDTNYIELAQIHKDRLKGFDFLSECSVSFISLFYKTIKNLPSVILITESDEIKKSIVGFYLLTTNKNEYMKYFLKMNMYQILFYPSAYIPIFKALWNKLFLKEKVVIDYLQEGVYLGVARGYDNGLGVYLIARAENEAKLRGIKELYATVFEKNQNALKINQALGYKIIAEQETIRGKKFILRKVFKVK